MKRLDLKVKRLVMLIAIATSLSACQNTPPQTACQREGVNCNEHATSEYSSKQKIDANDYSICRNASSYAGKVVGDGHCVSLIRRCSNLGFTNSWRPGVRVKDSDLLPGTVIATFVGDTYPNTRGYHAAIFIEHQANGFWVWDQWKGKPVHKRLIQYRKDKAPASNSAEAYRAVLNNR